ncbi:hypothetical protein [Pseudanabaena sp. FACHB-2040]|uniref:hypothetical protein n=1 Tax=Pseudanabaena sp. FACHB-2040 TaxID=2692859 RepID=UPI0016889DA0|nr:hypothetical protein [Pseudanabaena sp. FACHB-2040]MBD2257669.1 hypothetical protein [Pseudanabaena sp. FACHB-2040]
MLQIQYFLSAPLGESAQPPASVNVTVQPRRRRLRLYLVGSEADTRSAIDSLHILGYAERFEWSRVIAMPENGLVIRPDTDDVLRYLQRYRSP